MAGGGGRLSSVSSGVPRLSCLPSGWGEGTFRGTEGRGGGAVCLLMQTLPLPLLHGAHLDPRGLLASAGSNSPCIIPTERSLKDTIAAPGGNSTLPFVLQRGRLNVSVHREWFGIRKCTFLLSEFVHFSFFFLNKNTVMFFLKYQT